MEDNKLEYLNFKYIENKFNNGLLKINNNPVTEKTFNEFRNLIHAANRFYKDKWDLIFDDNSKEKDVLNIKYLFIHYPEFTIRNSKNDKHLIKNLFVKVQILNDYNENKIHIGGIYGLRTTQSNSESESSYFHSHLPSNSLIYCNGGISDSLFCLGSGNIRQAITKILIEDITVDIAFSFILSLHALIVWESLEGGPYKRIDTIKPKFLNLTSFPTSNFMAVQEHIVAIIDYIRNEKPILPLYIKSNGLAIEDLNVFKSIIMKFIEDKDNIYIKDDLLAIKDSEGNYYKYKSIDFIKEKIKSNQYKEDIILDSGIWFRGEFFQGIIEGIKQDEIEEFKVEYDITPEVLTIIKNLITNEINKNITKKSIFRRYQN